MDLSYTPEQETFRREVREWLAANAPRPALPSPGTREGFEAHRAWERALFDAGYAGIRWPREYGGRGADVITQAIFDEEYWLANAPERVVVIGQKLLGPTLMVHGSEEQRARWLPDILSAATIWSQGFSEPDAGSDLAGLTTRAERDGDAWVVNGQKIWTSYGAFADWIFVLARTNRDAPKHAGITMLATEMGTPGIEARPIVQLDGHAGFAEVFFTDVRVPGENAIGGVNDGWKVAMTMLGFERDSPPSAPARYVRDVRELAAIARRLGLDDDDRVRDAIAGAFAGAEAYRAHALRVLTRIARGDAPPAEASVTKLLWSELEQRIFALGREIMGPVGELLGEGSPARNPALWNTGYWFARAATIYAGTSEIQRNIVAERLLGLPKG